MLPNDIFCVIIKEYLDDDDIISAMYVSNIFYTYSQDRLDEIIKKNTCYEYENTLKKVHQIYQNTVEKHVENKRIVFRYLTDKEKNEDEWINTYEYGQLESEEDYTYKEWEDRFDCILKVSDNTYVMIHEYDYWTDRYEYNDSYSYSESFDDIVMETEWLDSSTEDSDDSIDSGDYSYTCRIIRHDKKYIPNYNNIIKKVDKSITSKYIKKYSKPLDQFYYHYGYHDNNIHYNINEHYLKELGKIELQIIEEFYECYKFQIDFLILYFNEYSLMNQADMTKQHTYNCYEHCECIKWLKNFITYYISF